MKPRGGPRGGISDLPVIEAKREAVRLFLAVTQEELPERVTVSRAVLIELIFFTINHTKSMRGAAIQPGSKVGAHAQLEAQRALLFAWLDKNLHRYKGRLDLCASDALHPDSGVKGVARSWSWIRDQITLYRNERKLPRC